jgi:LPS-assembly lipoprotein
MRLARTAIASRLGRIGVVFLVALSCGGCFQPLYGTATASGKNVNEQLRQIEIVQIAAPAGTDLSRLAVLIRNELIFNLNRGGSPATPPAYRLVIQATSGTLAITQGMTQVYAVYASYSLVNIATGTAMVSGTASAQSTTSVPGEQRLSRTTGLGDAGKRTAKEIADQIAQRLASYFFAPS